MGCYIFCDKKKGRSVLLCMHVPKFFSLRNVLEWFIFQRNVGSFGVLFFRDY